MAIRPDNYPDGVMAEIRIIESRCRDGLNRAGEVFLFDGHCPPICPELMAPMNHLLYAIPEQGWLFTAHAHLTILTKMLQ